MDIFGDGEPDPPPYSAEQEPEETELSSINGHPGLFMTQEAAGNTKQLWGQVDTTMYATCFTGQVPSVEN